jgi:tetratricopeptide (TPR) repeat protein
LVPEYRPRSDEVSALAGLGLCDDAIAAGRRLLADVQEFAKEDHVALGLAYRALGFAMGCDSRWVDAVSYYDLALQANPDANWSWQMERAIFAYQLGRSEEVLDYLDRDIAARPHYGGDRYFLRALIRFDLGDRDGALSDIEFGEGQTWMSIGLAPYVKGLLAMDDDPAQALLWLNLAELTLPVGYDAFLPRIRKDIRLAERLTAQLPSGQNGFVTPEATPTALWAGTPHPHSIPHSPLPNPSRDAGLLRRTCH